MTTTFLRQTLTNIRSNFDEIRKILPTTWEEFERMLFASLGVTFLFSLPYLLFFAAKWVLYAL